MLDLSSKLSAQAVKVVPNKCYVIYVVIYICYVTKCYVLHDQDSKATLLAHVIQTPCCQIHKTPHNGHWCLYYAFKFS